MRRIVALLVVAGVICLWAATADAAYRVVTLAPTSHAVLKTYGYGASPPRGRAQICMSDNQYGRVTEIQARVRFSNGISSPVNFTPWATKLRPLAGSCATADDFEWYFTRRHITGGEFRIWLNTGREQYWVCGLISCTQVA